MKDDHFKTAFMTCSKGRKSGRHKHGFTEHIVCIFGSYKVEVGEKTIILNQKDELHIPSGIQHSGECIADAGLIITTRKQVKRQA